MAVPVATTPAFTPGVPTALFAAPIWGAAGLTASAGVAGWVEMLMLRRTLNRRIGSTGLPVAFLFQLWGGALASGAGAWALKAALSAGVHPIVVALCVLPLYGLLYFGLMFALRVPEASAMLARLRSRP